MPIVYVLHFASSWMFGKLPEGEISGKKKVIYSITGMVDSRGFSFVFPQKLSAIPKCLSDRE